MQLQTPKANYKGTWIWPRLAEAKRTDKEGLPVVRRLPGTREDETSNGSTPHRTNKPGTTLTPGV